jgi:nanoRNase/pAp phosphatase (c-di-AMP/oligoRNAs hydrolase)
VRFLAQDADFNLVLSIQYAPYPRQIFRRFCSSLQAARMIGQTAVCFAPEIDSPAGMANMADMIIRCEDVHAVLAAGLKGNNCFITVRCRSARRRAGELAAALAAGMGSGGGHADRAAGQIPITADRDIHYVQNKLLSRWREIFDLADAPARPFLEC